MIIEKLNLNESHIIKYGMNVYGTTQQPSDIRFVIEGPQFDIVCKCKQVGEELEIDIPELKGILESKEYPARIEVIIGDKIFTPIKESIEFNPLVEFGLSKKEHSLKSEGVEIKINASSSSDVKKSPLQEQLDKVKDKYEVKEINGFNVLVKDELYYGFVSESSIIESEEGHSTLSELVNSLSN